MLLVLGNAGHVSMVLLLCFLAHMVVDCYLLMVLRAIQRVELVAHTCYLHSSARQVVHW